MRCNPEIMRLYAVTDRTWVGRQTLMEQVEAALKGGATCVQLREKELDEDAFLEEAMKMKRLCAKYGVPFIVNDKVSIAIGCGADGIHVGQGDMEAERVRGLVGKGMMVGVSVQTVEQAKAAQAAGADYLGVGAVFQTTTKPDAHEVTRQTLKDICEAVSIPVTAIGGINKINMAQLMGTGIDGVALVSAVFAAEDIEKECRELRAISEKMVQG